MNTYDQDQNQHTARPERRGSRAALYTSIGAAGLGAAGLVAALVVGLGGSPAIASHHGEHRESHSQISPVIVPVPVPAANGDNGANGGSSTPSVQPSATVRLLQEQLGELNYYEGPVNGLPSTQLTQAITYLQRDAHLPQTGVLNPASQRALDMMLASGNNHMGG